MGVDYTGNYGIGVRIIKKEFTEDSEYFEDFNIYLDDILEGTNYYYFEVGEGSYTGEKNKFYICISELFSDGLDIKDKVFDFYKFLHDNTIEWDGEVEEVGGLLVD